MQLPSVVEASSHSKSFLQNILDHQIQVIAERSFDCAIK